MIKKTFLFLVMVMFILGTGNLSFAMKRGGHSSHQLRVQAQSEHKHVSTDATVQAAPTQVMDVGNEICPISGEKIDKETKATYEYKGKIYNFCCPMCIEEFKKDPDKYINKMEKQKTARGA